MSILFMDSFDLGDTALKYSGNSPVISTLYGLHGLGARVGDDHADDLTLAFTNTDDSVVWASNVYFRSLANNSAPFVRFYGGGSRHFYLYWDNVLQEVSLRHDDGTVWVTGTSTHDAWHHVACKVLVDDTVGTYELWIDGVSVGSGTATDTRDGGTATVDLIDIAGTDATDINSMYIDDVVVSDTLGAAPQNTFLGVTEVGFHLPDGNGNTSAMTGSDGNSVDNYLLVDEQTPISTADYVGSATEGDLDTYSMDDLASTDVTVFGIQTALHAAKSDSGTQFMRRVLRSGGTNYAGVSFALSEGYVSYWEIIEEDPDTATDWTPAGINAVELGQEARDS